MGTSLAMYGELLVTGSYASSPTVHKRGATYDIADTLGPHSEPYTGDETLYYGENVAITVLSNGDTVVAVASEYYEAEGTADGGSTVTYKGAVFLYTSESGDFDDTTYTILQQPATDNFDYHMNFGAQVAMLGDRLLVSLGSGNRVYVYDHDQQSPGSFIHTHTLQGDMFTDFGVDSLSLSSEYIAVGAKYVSSYGLSHNGCVYVYDASTFTEVARFDGEADFDMLSRVAINSDVLALGAFHADSYNAGTVANSGRVYLYEKDSSNAFYLAGTVVGGGADYSFGHALAVDTSGGNTVVVGSACSDTSLCTASAVQYAHLITPGLVASYKHAARVAYRTYDIETAISLNGAPMGGVSVTVAARTDESDMTSDLTHKVLNFDVDNVFSNTHYVSASHPEIYICASWLHSGDVDGCFFEYPLPLLAIPTVNSANVEIASSVYEFGLYDSDSNPGTVGIGAVSLRGDWAVIGDPEYNSYVGRAAVLYHDASGWEWTQSLPATDAAIENAGTTVALSGTGYLYVGETREIGAVVTVYNLLSGLFQFVTDLTGAAAGADTHFGCSLAAVGDTLIVGACGDEDSDDGSWHYYQMVNDVPVHKQTVTGSATRLGLSMSLSPDAQTLAVSTGKPSETGTVYLYELDTDSNQYVWGGVSFEGSSVSMSSDDRYGTCVGVTDGGFVCVGAPSHSGHTDTQGKVVCYYLDSNGDYTEGPTLSAPTPAVNEYFGTGVAVVERPDSSIELVVSTAIGNAYSYSWGSGTHTWTLNTQMQRGDSEVICGMDVDTSAVTVGIKALFGVAGYGTYGQAMHLSIDEDVYVKSYSMGLSGGSLSPGSNTLSLSLTRLGDLTPVCGAYASETYAQGWNDFGQSSVSPLYMAYDGATSLYTQEQVQVDGGYALHFYAVSSANTHLSYITGRDGFYDGTVPTGPSYLYGDAVVTDTTTDATHPVASYAIAQDYSFAGVPSAEGASGETDVGVVHVYRRTNSSWSWDHSISPPTDTPNQEFGSSIATYGVWIAIQGYDGTEHVVYMYLLQNSGGSWIYVYHSTLRQTGSVATSQFGYSLSMMDFVLVVGAPYDLGACGSAYIFEYSTSTYVWELTKYLVPEGTTGVNNQRFGISVDATPSYSYGYVVIGASHSPGDIYPTHGEVYVYDRLVTSVSAGDVSWGQVYFYSELGNFGQSVAGNGSYIYVGAPTYTQTAGAEAGAVYVFRRTGTNPSTFSLHYTHAGTEAYQQLGHALSPQKSYVVAGSPGDVNPVSGDVTGSVAVYGSSSLYMKTYHWQAGAGLGTILASYFNTWRILAGSGTDLYTFQSLSTKLTLDERVYELGVNQIGVTLENKTTGSTITDSDGITLSLTSEGATHSIPSYTTQYLSDPLLFSAAGAEPTLGVQHEGPNAGGALYSSVYKLSSGSVSLLTETGDIDSVYSPAISIDYSAPEFRLLNSNGYSIHSNDWAVEVRRSTDGDASYRTCEYDSDSGMYTLASGQDSMAYTEGTHSYTVRVHLARGSVLTLTVPVVVYSSTTPVSFSLSRESVPTGVDTVLEVTVTDATDNTLGGSSVPLIGNFYNLERTLALTFNSQATPYTTSVHPTLPHSVSAEMNNSVVPYGGLLLGGRVAVSGAYAALSTASQEVDMYKYDASAQTYSFESLIDYSDVYPHDSLGCVFEVVMDGDWLAVSYGDLDIVLIYKLSGSSWSRAQRLDGTDGEGFGTSMAMEGRFLLVGAPDPSATGGYSGQVYVYHLLDSGVWTLMGISTNPTSGELYGTTLALDVSVDGVAGEEVLSMAISCGTPGTNSVLVSDTTVSSLDYVFGTPTTLTVASSHIGTGLALSGSVLAVSDTEADSTTVGKVYIYAVQADMTLDLMDTLYGSEAGDLFGSSLSLDGDYLAVSTATGHTTNSWTTCAKVGDIDPTGTDAGSLGVSLAMAEGCLLVGDPGYESSTGRALGLHSLLAVPYWDSLSDTSAPRTARSLTHTVGFTDGAGSAVDMGTRRVVSTITDDSNEYVMYRHNTGIYKKPIAFVGGKAAKASVERESTAGWDVDSYQWVLSQAIGHGVDTTLVVPNVPSDSTYVYFYMLNEYGNWMEDTSLTYTVYHSTLAGSSSPSTSTVGGVTGVYEQILLSTLGISGVGTYTIEVKTTQGSGYRHSATFSVGDGAVVTSAVADPWTLIIDRDNSLHLSLTDTEGQPVTTQAACEGVYLYDSNGDQLSDTGAMDGDLCVLPFHVSEVSATCIIENDQGDTVGASATYSSLAPYGTQTAVIPTASVSSLYGSTSALHLPYLAVADEGEGADAGVVYVYVLSGGTWTEATTLTGTAQGFGASLAYSEVEGTLHLFVGSPSDYLGEGAVHVYTEEGGAFVHSDTLLCEGSSPNTPTTGWGSVLSAHDGTLYVSSSTQCQDLLVYEHVNGWTQTRVVANPSAHPLSALSAGPYRESGDTEDNLGVLIGIKASGGVHWYDYATDTASEVTASGYTGVGAQGLCHGSTSQYLDYAACMDSGATLLTDKGGTQTQTSEDIQAHRVASDGVALALSMVSGDSGSDASVVQVWALSASGVPSFLIEKENPSAADYLFGHSLAMEAGYLAVGAPNRVATAPGTLYMYSPGPALPASVSLSPTSHPATLSPMEIVLTLDTLVARRDLVRHMTINGETYGLRADRDGVTYRATYVTPAVPGSVQPSLVLLDGTVLTPTSGMTVTGASHQSDVLDVAYEASGTGVNAAKGLVFEGPYVFHVQGDPSSSIARINGYKWTGTEYIQKITSWYPSDQGLDTTSVFAQSLAVCGTTLFIGCPGTDAGEGSVLLYSIEADFSLTYEEKMGETGSAGYGTYLACDGDMLTVISDTDLYLYSRHAVGPTVLEYTMSLSTPASGVSMAWPYIAHGVPTATLYGMSQCGYVRVMRYSSTIGGEMVMKSVGLTAPTPEAGSRFGATVEITGTRLYVSTITDTIHVYSDLANVLDGTDPAWQSSFTDLVSVFSPMESGLGTGMAASGGRLFTSSPTSPVYSVMGADYTLGTGLLLDSDMDIVQRVVGKHVEISVVALNHGLAASMGLGSGSSLQLYAPPVAVDAVELSPMDVYSVMTPVTFTVVTKGTDTAQFGSAHSSVYITLEGVVYTAQYDADNTNYTATVPFPCVTASSVTVTVAVNGVTHDISVGVHNSSGTTYQEGLYPSAVYGPSDSGLTLETGGVSVGGTLSVVSDGSNVQVFSHDGSTYAHETVVTPVGDHSYEAAGVLTSSTVYGIDSTCDTDRGCVAMHRDTDGSGTWVRTALLNPEVDNIETGRAFHSGRGDLLSVSMAEYASSTMQQWYRLDGVWVLAGLGDYDAMVIDGDLAAVSKNGQVGMLRWTGHAWAEEVALAGGVYVGCKFVDSEVSDHRYVYLCLASETSLSADRAYVYTYNPDTKVLLVTEGKRRQCNQYAFAAYFSSSGLSSGSVPSAAVYTRSSTMVSADQTATRYGTASGTLYTSELGTGSPVSALSRAHLCNTPMQMAGAVTGGSLGVHATHVGSGLGGTYTTLYGPRMVPVSATLTLHTVSGTLLSTVGRGQRIQVTLSSLVSASGVVVVSPYTLYLVDTEGDMVGDFYWDGASGSYTTTMYAPCLASSTYSYTVLARDCDTLSMAVSVTTGSDIVYAPGQSEIVHGPVSSGVSQTHTVTLHDVCGDTDVHATATVQIRWDTTISDLSWDGVSQLYTGQCLPGTDATANALEVIVDGYVVQRVSYVQTGGGWVQLDEIMYR
ncbi:LOW QUALITY PROTEIN: hypothetical protein KIPB_000760 [Kipferlia bialata]|uniref:Uncharacterized protein n=1 Tax=Kipferlia bialata TaxID=797122 RepID=A0A9K3CN01_9EUKA|nr:LOW QUALITY PROTEIN: hypothetical protein KIPB_000760 [Kipferlia bialata]